MGIMSMAFFVKLLAAARFSMRAAFVGASKYLKSFTLMRRSSQGEDYEVFESLMREC